MSTLGWHLSQLASFGAELDYYQAFGVLDLRFHSHSNQELAAGSEPIRG